MNDREQKSLVITTTGGDWIARCRADAWDKGHAGRLVQATGHSAVAASLGLQGADLRDLVPVSICRQTTTNELEGSTGPRTEGLRGKVHCINE